MTKRFSSARNSLCGNDLKFFVEYDGGERSFSFLRFNDFRKELDLLDDEEIHSTEKRWKALLDCVKTVGEYSLHATCYSETQNYFRRIWMWLKYLKFDGCYQLPDAVKANKRVKAHAEVLADLFLNGLTFSELRRLGCDTNTWEINASTVKFSMVDAVMRTR